MIISGIIASPLLAKEIPAVYHVIENYASSLLPPMIPEKASSSSNGIKMFVMDENKLKNSRMYGTFYITDDCVNGDFRLLEGK